MIPTLTRFVIEHGGGVLVAMDYSFSAADDRFPSLRALTDPCGFVFHPIVLSDATAEAELACVPDY